MTALCAKRSEDGLSMARRYAGALKFGLPFFRRGVIGPLPGFVIQK
jgi:hypothetical protein